MKRDSKLFREADRKLGIVWNRIESQITKAAQTIFARYRKLIKSYKSTFLFLSSFIASAFADVAG